MIIGLSGYSGSGKNQVADMLGPDYRQVSFAEPMKEAVYRLNPTVQVDGRISVKAAVNYFGWEIAKVHYPEIRRLLQVFGTEVGREMFGENFWVDIAMKDVHVGDDVVFTDVRFPNEAQAIVDMGGEVWRINRPGWSAVNRHVSETALDDWKFHRIIENDGTLGELEAKVHGKN